VSSDSDENKSNNASKNLDISNEVKVIDSAEPSGKLEDSKDQIATGNSPKDGIHDPETCDSTDNVMQECESQNTEGNKTETVDSGTNSAENTTKMSVSSEKVTGWTESKLRKEWRKFNLDLSPKVC
jgi:hypothetical protein